MTATIHSLPLSLTKLPEVTLSVAALDMLHDLAEAPDEPMPKLAALLTAPSRFTERPYIDQIAAARRVYAASPKRIEDWCDYLEVVEALRARFGR